MLCKKSLLSDWGSKVMQREKGLIHNSRGPDLIHGDRWTWGMSVNARQTERKNIDNLLLNFNKEIHFVLYMPYTQYSCSWEVLHFHLLQLKVHKLTIKHDVKHQDLSPVCVLKTTNRYCCFIWMYLWHLYVFDTAGLGPDNSHVPIIYTLITSTVFKSLQADMTDMPSLSWEW